MWARSPISRMTALGAALAVSTVAVTITVDPTIGGGCDLTSPNSWRCHALKDALEQVHGLTPLPNGTPVVVAFSSVVSTADGRGLTLKQPPNASSVALVGSGDAAIDGGGKSALLSTDCKNCTVRGVAFVNGYVNITHGKDMAPVLVQGHNTFFVGCRFAHNRGYDGGAVLSSHNLISFNSCTFSDNVAFHGGDGHAHVSVAAACSLVARSLLLLLLLLVLLVLTPSLLSLASQDTGGGGAIWAYSSKIFLLNSVFKNNIAVDPPPNACPPTGKHACPLGTWE